MKLNERKCCNCGKIYHFTWKEMKANNDPCWTMICCSKECRDKLMAPIREYGAREPLQNKKEIKHMDKVAPFKKFLETFETEEMREKSDKS